MPGRIQAKRWQRVTANPYRPVWARSFAMLQCKISLAYERPIIYIVHRSNAVTDRAVCFLGRFLPKLGGSHKEPPSFYPAAATKPQVSAKASDPAASPAMDRVMSSRTSVNRGSRSMRLSSI
jgi:hypothetical protein